MDEEGVPYVPVYGNDPEEGGINHSHGLEGVPSNIVYRNRGDNINPEGEQAQLIYNRNLMIQTDYKKGAIGDDNPKTYYNGTYRVDDMNRFNINTTYRGDDLNVQTADARYKKMVTCSDINLTALSKKLSLYATETVINKNVVVVIIPEGDDTYTYNCYLHDEWTRSLLHTHIHFVNTDNESQVYPVVPLPGFYNPSRNNHSDTDIEEDTNIEEGVEEPEKRWIYLNYGMLSRFNTFLLIPDANIDIRDVELETIKNNTLVNNLIPINRGILYDDNRDAILGNLMTRIKGIAEIQMPFYPEDYAPGNYGGYIKGSAHTVSLNISTIHIHKYGFQFNSICVYDIYTKPKYTCVYKCESDSAISYYEVINGENQKPYYVLAPIYRQDITPPQAQKGYQFKTVLLSFGILRPYHKYIKIESDQTMTRLVYNNPEHNEKNDQTFIEIFQPTGLFRIWAPRTYPMIILDREERLADVNPKTYIFCNMHRYYNQFFRKNDETQGISVGDAYITNDYSSTTTIATGKKIVRADGKPVIKETIQFIQPNPYNNSFNYVSISLEDNEVIDYFSQISMSEPLRARNWSVQFSYSNDLNGKRIFARILSNVREVSTLAYFSQFTPVNANHAYTFCVYEPSNGQTAVHMIHHKYLIPSHFGRIFYRNNHFIEYYNYKGVKRQYEPEPLTQPIQLGDVSFYGAIFNRHIEDLIDGDIECIFTNGIPMISLAGNIHEKKTPVYRVKEKEGIVVSVYNDVVKYIHYLDFKNDKRVEVEFYGNYKIDDDDYYTETINDAHVIDELKRWVPLDGPIIPFIHDMTDIMDDIYIQIPDIYGSFDRNRFYNFKMDLYINDQIVPNEYRLETLDNIPKRVVNYIKDGTIVGVNVDADRNPFMYGLYQINKKQPLNSLLSYINIQPQFLFDSPLMGIQYGVDKPIVPKSICIFLSHMYVLDEKNSIIFFIDNIYHGYMPSILCNNIDNRVLTPYSYRNMYIAYAGEKKLGGVGRNYISRNKNPLNVEEIPFFEYPDNNAFVYLYDFDSNDRSDSEIRSVRPKNRMLAKIKIDKSEQKGYSDVFIIDSNKKTLLGYKEYQEKNDKSILRIYFENVYNKEGNIIGTVITPSLGDYNKLPVLQIEQNKKSPFGYNVQFDYNGVTYTTDFTPHTKNAKNKYKESYYTVNVESAIYEFEVNLGQEIRDSDNVANLYTKGPDGKTTYFNKDMIAERLNKASWAIYDGKYYTYEDIKDDVDLMDTVDIANMVFSTKHGASIIAIINSFTEFIRNNTDFWDKKKVEGMEIPLHYNSIIPITTLSRSREFIGDDRYDDGGYEDGGYEDGGYEDGGYEDYEDGGDGGEDDDFQGDIPPRRDNAIGGNVADRRDDQFAGFIDFGDEDEDRDIPREIVFRDDNAQFPAREEPNR